MQFLRFLGFLLTIITTFFLYCTIADSRTDDEGTVKVINRKQIVQLGEKNWTSILNGEWMIEFFAPWCPACKNLQPVWEELAEESVGYNVAQVDVTTSPGLSGRFIVTALPTIFHAKDGKFRQYKGSRAKAAFRTYIIEMEWKDVEPIPVWKSPDSVQMGLLAYLFELSIMLRGVHNKLSEDFGFPTWATYFLFAIATIFIGVLIGLGIVCLIDYFHPRDAADKKTGRPFKPPDHVHGDDTEDEIATKDEIIDDAAGTSHAKKRKARKAD